MGHSWQVCFVPGSLYIKYIFKVCKSIIEFLSSFTPTFLLHLSHSLTANLASVVPAMHKSKLLLYQLHLAESIMQWSRICPSVPFFLTLIQYVVHP